MAESTINYLVPMVGLNNIPLVDDAGTLRRAVVDASGDFVPVTDVGDGIPSSTISSPEGNPGSLKTVMQLLFRANQATDGFFFDFTVKIPPGTRGAVSEAASIAELQDTDNWPVWDASKLTPHCDAMPMFGVFHPNDDPPPGSGTFPPTPASFATNEQWDPGNAITIGMVGYTPPQFLPPALLPELGQYGLVTVRCQFSIGGTPIQSEQGVQITIDFSNTIVN